MGRTQPLRSAMKAICIFQFSIFNPHFPRIGLQSLSVIATDVVIRRCVLGHENIEDVSSILETNGITRRWEKENGALP